jgi:GST-like protein
MKYVLYRGNGFGSTCVEAALELLNLPYDRIDVEVLGSAQERARVRAVNPAGQIPALVLPNDDLMTESAGILIYLGDLHPEAGLAPTPDAPQRPDYLRWLLFLSSNYYSTFAITDGPERFLADERQHPDLLAKSLERRKQLWKIMEDGVFPGPYILGGAMSLLDVYVAMMSHWSPRRDWFFEHCPRLSGAVCATEAHPIIRSVWKRNFDLEAV